MTDYRKLAAACGVASVALLAGTGAAVADGYETHAPPPPPPQEEARKFTYSFNIAGTSDYVFRGISQNDNDPTMQGGMDFAYGILYAGGWASGINFDAIFNDADLEIDWYGGIKPTWGIATFDFGAIYYSYPNAGYQIEPPFGFDLNYWELKAGVSGTIHKDLALGLIVYYSPDYFAQTGSVWTVEGSGGYTFHAVGPFTPSITGVVGYQDGQDAYYEAWNGFDHYWYFNGGLVLAVEKISFDFRYWGTADAKNAVSEVFSCINNYCDDRFVFTVKVALP